jgi:transposase
LSLQHPLGIDLFMARKNNPDPKDLVLRQQGSLNPHPGQVTDELFRTNDFFDARDLVQVKYEMLRRVQNDGQSVSRSAADFGFSRPSFYQAQAAFQQGGLPALMPHKRGPREAHKLTAEVLAFVRQTRQEDPSLRPADVAARVSDRYGITVHPRSIERALARSQKNRGEPNLPACHCRRGFCRSLRATALRGAEHDHRS